MRPGTTRRPENCDDVMAAKAQGWREGGSNRPDDNDAG
jgi:hypothetical protein